MHSQGSNPEPTSSRLRVFPPRHMHSCVCIWLQTFFIFVKKTSKSEFFLVGWKFYRRGPIDPIFAGNRRNIAEKVFTGSNYASPNEARNLPVRSKKTSRKKERIKLSTSIFSHVITIVIKLENDLHNNMNVRKI